MANQNEVTTPVVKAVTALGAGAGTSAVSMMQQAESFLPKDANGWVALGASTVALLYSLHLMTDFYWRRVWRPFFERRGWIKARRRVARIVYDDEDDQAAA